MTNLRDRGERRERVMGARKNGTGPRAAEGLARSRRWALGSDGSILPRRERTNACAGATPAESRPIEPYASRLNLPLIATFGVITSSSMETGRVGFDRSVFKTIHRCFGMKNIYEVLRQKELDRARLEKEVAALRVAAPLLVEAQEASNDFVDSEPTSSGSPAPSPIRIGQPVVHDTPRPARAVGGEARVKAWP